MNPHSPAIHSTQAAGHSDWLAADEAALDCVATRIAQKFGVSAEVIAKQLRAETLWPSHPAAWHLTPNGDPS